MKVLSLPEGATNLYSLSDVGRASGIRVSSLWIRAYQLNTLQRPTVQIGKRWYYTTTEYVRLVEKLHSERERRKERLRAELARLN